MKKNKLYLLLILVFIATLGFVVVKYNKKNKDEAIKEYTFLPRKGKDKAEADFAKNNIESLLLKIRNKPSDNKSRVALANAFINESRITGNNAYYDKAAMSTVNQILEKEPANFEALTLKSLLFLSQHHFADALATATTAANINPENAFVYGLLVDANVEMGNYEAAVAAAENMITIRPDLTSYSRIAYLREIHGDYPGAIEAMNRAVRAGVPGQESTEWCRVQLGKLYEKTGDLQDAAYQYKLSLAARPEYAYALAGLGRLAMAEKKYDSAVYYYEQADQLISDYDIKDNLASSYRLAGKTEKSESLYNQLIKEMGKNAKDEMGDESIGHYADKELAYVYLHTGNLDKALEHALAEYNRRPNNIDVNETVAWVYYNRKETAEATPYIKRALLTNSANPTLLAIAGLLDVETGNIEKGKTLIETQLLSNAVLPEVVKRKCLETINK